MSEEIIKINHLRKSFGENEVLKDISMDIHKGEVVTIIGSSGSGKSTFLRCINLLEKPTGGEIMYNGERLCAVFCGLYCTCAGESYGSGY